MIDDYRTTPKRKCILCKKKGYYDMFVDISVAKQGMCHFDICKECLKDLNMMLSRLNSGLIDTKL